ncbi:DUF3152 domain-containing protein [Solwaraspora sp. WMMB335]|uniref:DUF3152 domain-containing protein n=1 Tax=Solwaraspora sp. WMMB335 TaxID=3404118 RepID=UPI003B9239BE
MAAAVLIGADLVHAGAGAVGRVPTAVREPGPGGGASSAGADAEPDRLPPVLRPQPEQPVDTPEPAPPPDTGSGGPDGPDGPPAPPVTYPQTGPGTFAFLTGAGPVLGWAGELRRFRVAVEDGISLRPDEFAAVVDATLGDDRSWVAGRQFRLQRVPRTAAAEFTIYLATPGTSEQMCALGGLVTEKYTSCRLPGQVIINMDRWMRAVPDYGAPLAVYRAYAINHEVGHQFGMGHELCPAPGRPAPVMQQQTYGLQGCQANGWPYVDGKRYTGPPMP